MARTKTTAQKPTTQADVEAASQVRHETRLRVLQGTLNDTCGRISDNPVRSFTSRAIKYRSIGPKVVEAGFRAIEAAVADGRKRYAAAQERGGGDAPALARVDLTAI